MRKNILPIVLLSAGIVLSMAGCQKGNPSRDLSGKVVRFEAVSSNPSTRTTFSGDGTQSGTSTDEFGRKILTRERINWAVDDPVMVASDNATVYESTQQYATYTVESYTENGEVSVARLAEKESSEELFFNEAESYKFWGVYPASAADGSKLVNAQAEYTIGNAQAPTSETPATVTVDTKTLKTLPADMTQAVMLSAAENQTTQSVEMEFYPGFTAFEFTLNSAISDLILKELVLSPADENKSLAGTVTATIKTEGNSEYTIAYPDDKKLTYTFPENTTITKTDYVTFTVFAVPEDIEGLTLEFHLGEDGSEVQTAHLKKNGEDIKLDKCRKHSFRGVAVQGGWSFLTLDIDVLDWVEVEVEESNGDGAQATQFAVSGASSLRYVKGNDKDYRQCWVFGPEDEVTVTYKIMMPSGTGTWSIEKLGDTDDFTVSVTATVTSSDGTTTVTPSAVDNSYSGDLATTGATYITITIKAADTTQSGVKTIYFNTYASNGTSTYSLDSETQLYDMRGHHYFILNGTADTTWGALNI